MKRFLSVFLLLAFLLAAASPSGAQAGPVGQGSTPRAQAEAMLTRMTPEEKVGQLFLITFKGSEEQLPQDIYDLIAKKHAGGVVLSRENDNFEPWGRTAASAYTLISQLQTAEWTASQQFGSDPVTGATFKPSFIPLLVGISQAGDGYPYDQILNGLTPLPNALALGATWKPELAGQVGGLLGNELSALGFNLLLGPSLDVQPAYRPGEGYEDLGARSFGGSPYWVGEMGRSFISGVHEGSDGRMAVVASYFPGRGSADRSPLDEVATVRKSLEELLHSDMVPFFAAMTIEDPLSTAVTDALMLPHVRYGFQGNIRETTRPVSFDAAAIDLLMSQPQSSTWRQADGLIVSEDLGSRAVRRFYDPTETVFDGRQVALDAFLAGNDLLYADQFTGSGDESSIETVANTLDFFAQKYREDTAFAQRVDASVTRILTLKYKLYTDFNINTVIPDEASLSSLGSDQQVTFDVARQAATLISPSMAELDTLMPRPPDLRDQIVFFTDSEESKQCERCQAQEAFGVSSLESAVLRLYGPLAAGRVIEDRLSSYAYGDLWALLNGAGETPENLQNDLNEADWVVFSMLNISSSRPYSGALRQLLSQRPDLLRNKRVVVFAFNSPYFLDATEISKLTAYYGLYSKGPAFVDVAARVLFKELTPSGGLPVSVPGVGYDLSTATAADPNQVIPLYLDLPEPTPATSEVTPAPTAIPTFNVGDVIPLRTGIIYDHNHRPVPDNTLVHFRFTIGGDTTTMRQIEARTMQGEARASYRIEKPGLLEISVVSEPAVASGILRLDITGIAGAVVTAIAPTSEPTLTPTPSPTPSPTPTPTPTPEPKRSGEPNGTEWLLAILLISAGAGLAYMTGFWWLGSIRWALRWALCAVVGGLAAYLYLSLGLPGSEALVQDSSTGGVMGVTLIGVAGGWAAALIWWAAEGGEGLRRAGSERRREV